MRAHSFYLFDLDHNLINTQSPTFLYHKESGEELRLKTSHYSKIRKDIGRQGEFKDYEEDGSDGRSFRYFQDGDHFLEELESLVEQQQPWRGPSWEIFCRALKKGRHMSIITARATAPKFIQEGFDLLHRKKVLPEKVNFLEIYAVSSAETQKMISGSGKEDIAELKCKAISHFVEEAYRQFGREPSHKFGMSDDDPKNTAAAFQQFSHYKKINPHHSFYIFEASEEGISEQIILAQ